MPSIQFKKQYAVFSLVIYLAFYNNSLFSQKLQINDSSYFEKRGVNVLVFSNEYSGMFFDEKTSAIELYITACEQQPAELNDYKTYLNIGI